jgi:hypothetical protein
MGFLIGEKLMTVQMLSRGWTDGGGSNCTPTAIKHRNGLMRIGILGDANDLRTITEISEKITPFCMYAHPPTKLSLPFIPKIIYFFTLFNNFIFHCLIFLNYNFTIILLLQCGHPTLIKKHLFSKV